MNEATQRKLRRLANVLLLVGLLGIIFSLALPARGSTLPGNALALIPPSPAVELGTGNAKCDEYLAMGDTERIDQWSFTLQTGLRENPGLGAVTWLCVIEFAKMVETDDFVVRGCKEEGATIASFEDLVFRAIQAHLNKCDVGIVR